MPWYSMISKRILIAQALLNLTAILLINLLLIILLISYFYNLRLISLTATVCIDLCVFNAGLGCSSTCIFSPLFSQTNMVLKRCLKNKRYFWWLVLKGQKFLNWRVTHRSLYTSYMFISVLYNIICDMSI